MRSPRSVLAVGLALALLAAACGDDDGGAPTTTTVAGDLSDAGVGPNGIVPDPIRWTECSDDECAIVAVPLDYDAPEGEQITLSVLRVPASGDRIGALFVNPGGPGGSAVAYAGALAAVLPESITERFDLVGVEPRGLDGSAPLRCDVDYTALYGGDPTVEDAGDRAALLEGAVDVAEACEASAAELLPHVGTRDVARDIDSVRAAMGEATLSYYGGSYGTAIGQVYAELFPQRVRAMVLDAVVELGPTGLELAAQQAIGFERTLEAFVDHCESEGCETENPLEAIDRVLELAEELDGIPAPSADRAAGPGEANIALSSALYTDENWPVLDQALSDALDGDGSLLVLLADHYLGAGNWDVYFAVNCLDFAWPTGDSDAFFTAAEAADADAPHFGEALVIDYLRCVDWPTPPEPLTPVIAPGAPPILVVSSTGDPATPYKAGVAVAERLESGVLLTNEGDSHGAVGNSACVDTIVAAYLIDGAVPDDGHRCRSYPEVPSATSRASVSSGWSPSTRASQ